MTNSPMSITQDSKRVPALISCRALRVVYTNSVHNEPSVLTMELIREMSVIVFSLVVTLCYTTLHIICASLFTHQSTYHRHLF